MNTTQFNKEFKKFSKDIHSPEWLEADIYAPDMGNAFLSEGWSGV